MSYNDMDTPSLISLLKNYQGTEAWPEGELGGILAAFAARDGDYWVETPEGMLTASYAGDGGLYDGISVSLNTPKGRADLVLAEAVGDTAAADYPTSVHSFVWNGDEEDATRIDYNLNGEYGANIV